MNYVKSWFTLDIIVVGPDWAFTSLQIMNGETGANIGNLLSLLRTFRMVRVLRLVRIAKRNLFDNSDHRSYRSKVAVLVGAIVRCVDGINSYVSHNWIAYWIALVPNR